MPHDEADDIDAAIVDLANRRKSRTRRLVAALVITTSAVSLGVLVSHPRFFGAPGRPVVVEPPDAPPPPEPKGPVGTFDWPKVRAGQKVEWTAAPDPSAKLLELSKDVGTGDFVRDVAREREELKDFSPGSRFLLAGPLANVKMLDPGPADAPLPARNRRVIDTVDGKTVSITMGSEREWLHPDGGHVIYVAHQGPFEVQDIPARNGATLLERPPEGHVLRAELAGPDKALIVTSHGEFPKRIRFHVWDWPNKKRLLVDIEQPSNLFHFGCGVLSPGGRYFITLGRLTDEEDCFGPDQLVVYDLKTGKIAGQREIAPPPRPKVPNPAVAAASAHRWHSIAFAPDGRRLAALRSDGRLHLWNFADGELVFIRSLGSPWVIRNHKQHHYPIAVFDENEPVLVGSGLYSSRTGVILSPGGKGRDGQPRIVHGYPAPGVVRVVDHDPRGNQVFTTLRFDRDAIDK